MKIGEHIPDFEAQTHENKIISKTDLLGHYNVLFFYPKDQSPVCTTEACSFRDNHLEFEKLNCKIIGISSDSIESHKKFAEKYNLNFPLISDKGDRLRKIFGVKNDMFGLMPGRETLLLDPNGKIVFIFNSQLNGNSHITKTIEILKKEIQKQEKN